VVTVGAFELSNEDDPVLAKTKIQVQAPRCQMKTRTNNGHVQWHQK